MLHETTLFYLQEKVFPFTKTKTKISYGLRATSIGLGVLQLAFDQDYKKVFSASVNALTQFIHKHLL
jgi:hypothetical protein